jgi:hypothetical protein
MPVFGMLAHSFARVLDRNKQYDVDAARFVRRYRMYVLQRVGYAVKNIFRT